MIVITREALITFLSIAIMVLVFIVIPFLIIRGIFRVIKRIYYRIKYGTRKKPKTDYGYNTVYDIKDRWEYNEKKRRWEPKDKSRIKEL